MKLKKGVNPNDIEIDMASGKEPCIRIWLGAKGAELFDIPLAPHSWGPNQSLAKKELAQSLTDGFYLQKGEERAILIATFKQLVVEQDSLN